MMTMKGTSESTRMLGYSIPHASIVQEVGFLAQMDKLHTMQRMSSNPQQRALGP